MAIPHLLVVDDDAEMRDMMLDYLRVHGFAARAAATEAGIRAEMAAGRIDLILLDVMLGDENGVEICARLRAEAEVPIVLVSALSADHQRMAGYEGGADDYVAKPFNPDLLLARVRAVLRRGRRTPSLAYRRGAGVWTFAGWRFDGKRGEVHSPRGYLVPLSQREVALLKVLLANPHVPLGRGEIATALGEACAPGETGPTPEGQSRAIDVLVGRLRSKIEADPKSPRILRTERGVGYVLGVDVLRVAP